MKQLLLKTAAVLLCALLLSPVLAGCNKTEAPTTDESGVAVLTFSGAIDYGTLQSLQGKTVSILGYMATLSPVSGAYMYLMNLPYQSCPYCVPNTNQLSNTMAVYAPDGKKFDFTDGPIRVTGTLELGDFTDEYSYTYNYRITNASYRTVDSDSLSGNMKLWQKIADDGLTADVYAMFDYVYFLCNWTEYTAAFQDGEDYLYPADVSYFQENQYTKESAAGYYDALVQRAEAFDDAITDALAPVIRRAEALATRAQQELDNGNYTYSGEKYVLTNSEQLLAEWNAAYLDFATWLEQFSA